MAQPLKKKLPIEVLLRWHLGSVRKAAQHPRLKQPDVAGARMLRNFLGVTDSGEWKRIMTSAGVPMGKRGGLTREECLRVMNTYYARRGEMLFKKWELEERQVGTFRKPSRQ